MGEVDWTFNDGSTETMRLVMDMYNENSNLYLGLKSLDGSEVLPLTVNTGIVMGYPYAAIDVNGAGDKALDWLQEQGLAKPVGQKIHSTWVSYPIVTFNTEKLREIDPKTFAAYREAHGFLPEKELNELADEAKRRAAEKNTHRGNPSKDKTSDISR